MIKPFTLLALPLALGRTTVTAHSNTNPVATTQSQIVSQAMQTVDDELANYGEVYRIESADKQLLIKASISLHNSIVESQWK